MSENPADKLSLPDAWQQLSDEARLEFEIMFAAMQTAQHRKGADQSFALADDDLGKLALKHMNSKA